jgi:hypothetical protein
MKQSNRRTSLSIQRRRDRLAFLTDPDRARLDPEVRLLKACLLAGWLAYDAKRHSEPIEVRVDARGDLHFYAPAAFDLRHAQSSAGQIYRHWIELERKYGPELREGPNVVSGVEFHFRRNENRQHRAWLRRFEKTKRGMAEVAYTKAEALRRASFIREVVVKDRKLSELVKAMPKAELSRLGIDPTRLERPYIHRPLRTNFPEILKLKRPVSKPPNATTWRKGGPNPRRRVNPDS